ncbi:unnamed protein product [Closterium sp. NIES-64]|nr:unnamed protein product [Closterium sp. NIES-64]
MDSSCGNRQRRSAAINVDRESDMIDSFANYQAVADKEIRLRRARRRAPLDLLHDLDKVEERITVRVEDIVSSSQLDSRQHQQDYAKDIAAHRGTTIVPVCTPPASAITAAQRPPPAAASPSCAAKAGRCHRYAPLSLTANLSAQGRFRRFGGDQHVGLPAPDAASPSRAAKTVVVTGIGMVTPLGMGATATWQRLIGGDSAIRALTPSDIAVPGMTDSLAAALLSQLPSLPSHMPSVVPPPFETSALPSLCAPLSPLSSPSPSLHAPFPPLPLPSPGIGMVTPLGVGSAATWQHLIGGNSAIRALTPSDIAIPGMTDSLAAALLSQLPSRIAGVVPPVPPAPPAPPVAANDRPDSPSAAHAGVEGDKSGLEGMPRFVQHAIRAADEAMMDARWMPEEEEDRVRTVSVDSTADEAMMDARWMPEEEEDRVRTGVCVGGGIGSISEVAAAGHLLFEQKPRRISPHFVPRILINMAAGHISIRHRLKGPNHASVTACASSAHAIADAFRLVRCGAADVIVAGGTEACVDALSLAGFSRMRALSTRFNDTPHLASRPFDKSRDGFPPSPLPPAALHPPLALCRMAEGAGVLVLEDLDHAVQRGAKVYAEVRGAGSSADAFHITQPSPLATGAVLCMRAALKEAGLQPSDIGYLNAHATSTPLVYDIVTPMCLECSLTQDGTHRQLTICDEIEALALKAVFDQHLLSGDLSFNPRDEIEALALKAVFDQHVLSGDLSFSSSKGAMGHLLGAAGAVEAAVAVMALHHGVVPPNVNLVNPDPVFQGSFLPTAAAASKPMRAVMSNSFGFGGTNASLVFGLPPRTPNNPPTLTPLSPHAHPSFPSRSPLFPLTLTPLSPHAHPSFPSRSPLFPLTLTPLSPHAHPSFPSRSPLFPLMLTPLSPHAHPSFPSSSPLFPPTLTPLSPHAHPLFPPMLTPSFPPRSPLFPRGSHP